MERFRSQIIAECCYAEWCSDGDAITCTIYWGDGDDWVARGPMAPGEANEVECLAIQDLILVLQEHKRPASARVLEEWLKLDAKKKTVPFAAFMLGSMMGGGF